MNFENLDRRMVTLPSPLPGEGSGGEGSVQKA